jgi:hypothetical protein
VIAPVHGSGRGAARITPRTRFGQAEPAENASAGEERQLTQREGSQLLLERLRREERAAWGVDPDGTAYLDVAERIEMVRAAYRARLAREVRKIEDDYESRLKGRSYLSTMLSRLSPASCFTAIAAECSGTGLREIENLKARAAKFQSEAEERWYSKGDVIVATKLLLSGGGEFGVPPGFDRNDQPKPVPPTMEEYRPPAFRAILNGIWLDSLLLALYAALFFALAYVRFLHFDLR